MMNKEEAVMLGNTAASSFLFGILSQRSREVQGL